MDCGHIPILLCRCYGVKSLPISCLRVTRTCRNKNATELFWLSIDNCKYYNLVATVETCRNLFYYGRQMPFEKLYSCLEENPLSQSSAERIIRASKQYGDGIHIELETTTRVRQHPKCSCSSPVCC